MLTAMLIGQVEEICRGRVGDGNLFMPLGRQACPRPVRPAPSCHSCECRNPSRSEQSFSYAVQMTIKLYKIVPLYLWCMRPDHWRRCPTHAIFFPLKLHIQIVEMGSDTIFSTLRGAGVSSRYCQRPLDWNKAIGPAQSNTTQ